MSLTYIKLVNVLLRIGGIGSKFILLTLMSKYFNVDVFGNYGLITSFITILIFLLGVDFYNFSIRDILKTKNIQITVNKLVSSLLLYIVIYFIFIIIGSIFFKEIPYLEPFVFLVIGLGITEHFSQESYRLLIGFKRVLLANVLLFIRTIGWCGIIIYYYYTKIPITINLILSLWLIFNFATILIVLFYGVLVGYKYIIKAQFNSKWVYNGLRVCSIFFIATISIKLMEYGNRFIVDYFMGKEMAGVFLFYSNISILITVYVNTIVISFELPELISSVKSPSINNLLKKFRKSLLKHVVISSFFLILIIKPLLIWQDKTEFENFFPLFFLLVTGSALMNYSLLNHFKLYIFHYDKPLLKAMVMSAIFSLVITIALTHSFGVYGAGIAFVISSIFLYYMRFNAVKKNHYD